MKLLPLTLIACLTFTVLGGCATGPTASQLANADYGTPITESAAKAKAEAWMRGILKDPESARIEWASFKQGWAAEGLFYGGGYLYGYLLDGWVNARNSFGGYTGRRRYVLMFHNGEIAAVWSETEGTSGGFMSRLK